jgi:hypothetical protein
MEVGFKNVSGKLGNTTGGRLSKYTYIFHHNRSWLVSHSGLETLPQSL